MARADHIYLVVGKISKIILAAFTVKHEANNWADDCSEDGKDQLQLERVSDGRAGPRGEVRTLLPWD